ELGMDWSPSFTFRVRLEHTPAACAERARNGNKKGALFLRRRRLLQRLTIPANRTGGHKHHPLRIEILRRYLAHVLRRHALDGAAIVVEKAQAKAVSLNVEQLCRDIAAGCQLQRQTIPR